MGIDIAKLENVKHKGNTIIARCPACAEEGKDRKGEHLFIDSTGRFGCITSPGTEGKKHRKRIFQLIGLKIDAKAGFRIKLPEGVTTIAIKPIQKDILGRLGRGKFIFARKENKPNISKNIEGFTHTVPGVPEFSPEEKQLLEGIDKELLATILLARRIFNGVVVAVE